MLTLAAVVSVNAGSRRKGARRGDDEQVLTTVDDDGRVVLDEHERVIYDGATGAPERTNMLVDDRQALY